MSLHFKRLLLTDLLRCDCLNKLPSQGIKNSPRKKRKRKDKLRTHHVNIKDKRKNVHEKICVIVLDECEEQSCLALQQKH
jgi:hypothetical protein